MFPDPPASVSTFNIQNTPKGKSFPWPDITDLEAKDAIFDSAANKAPGPDGINFLCLRYVYQSIPTPLVDLFKVLLTTG